MLSRNEPNEPCKWKVLNHKKHTINCYDNEYNVNRCSFSWAFFPYMYIFSTIFFMHMHLEIAFEIQNTFGSMWILCVVALASAHILMFFCDAIEFQSCCQAHTTRNEENRQEIIWEPHSNIQVLSIFSHFNCVCVHCTRDFTFACVYECSCVWSCYDFVCEIFSVGNRMLLIILTVNKLKDNCTLH